MKRLQHLFFFAFLISLIGFGSEIMAKTNDALLSCITESRELREMEEDGNRQHAFEDQRIKQVGAGGSDLEEIEINQLPQNTLPLLPPNIPLSLLSDSDSSYLTSYYLYLFQTLYFPKLYILFHCTKAFLS